MILFGCYSDQSITIDGDGQALLQFAVWMLEPRLPRDWYLSHPKQPPPHPYQHYLASVRIEETVGKVTIALDKAEAVISGGRESLGLIGLNIRALAEDVPLTPYALTVPGCAHFDTEEYLTDFSLSMYVYRVE